LDKRYNIVRFVPFDLDVIDASNIIVRASTIVKRSGEAGVIGFIFQSGDFVYGTFSEMESILSRNLEIMKNEPFLSLEVSRFLRNSDASQRALLVAEAKFQNRQIADNWTIREHKAGTIEIERAVAAFAQKPKNSHLPISDTDLENKEFANYSYKDLFEWLQKRNFADRRWSMVWLRLCMSIQSSEFYELGIEWLFSVHRSDSKRSWKRILSIIADSSFKDQLVVSAQNALESEEWTGAFFVHIWRFLLRMETTNFNDISKQRLLRIGQVGLLKSLPKNSADGRQWIAMLQDLMRLDTEDGQLQRSIFNALASGRISQRVWLETWRILLDVRPGDHSLLALGLDKIRDQMSFPRTWAGIWLKLIEDQDSVRELISVHELEIWGVRFLDRGEKNSNAWGSVWLKLFEGNPESNVLVAKAFTWLSAANSSMGVWPKIWVTLMQRDPSNDKLKQIGISSLGYDRTQSILKDLGDAVAE
jgi:hypothetical protein